MTRPPVDLELDLPTGLRVGVSGTQRGLTPVQGARLYDVLRALDPRELHHGDCVGVDYQAHVYFTFLFEDRPVHVHPPTDPRLRAYASSPTVVLHAEHPYLRRNGHVVAATDLLVACPSESKERLRSGTWATVRAARRLYRPTLLLYPDGTLVGERLERLASRVSQLH